MDFRFSVSSVDLTEKDKSGNEANLTLPHGCEHLYYTIKNVLKEFVSFDGHLSGFQVFRELGGPNGKRRKWQRSKSNPTTWLWTLVLHCSEHLKGVCIV